MAQVLTEYHRNTIIDTINSTRLRKLQDNDLQDII